MTENPTNARFN